MGYFSNGSEHDNYSQLCERCVHGQDDQKGCPVMDLHWLWNYDQNKNKEFQSALSMFIPRDKEGWNKQCTMFVQIQDAKQS